MKNSWWIKKGMFLNHVQSIELATGGLQSSCRDIPRMIKGNWMHLSSIWSVIGKTLNTVMFVGKMKEFHRKDSVE